MALPAPTPQPIPPIGAADLVIRAQRAYLDGSLRAAAVVVADGRVAAVLPVDADVPDATELRVDDDAVLLPGYTLSLHDALPI